MRNVDKLDYLVEQYKAGNRDCMLSCNLAEVSCTRDTHRFERVGIDPAYLWSKRGLNQLARLFNHIAKELED